MATLNPKLALRAAVRIYNHLCDPPAPVADCTLPGDLWDVCSGMARRITKARERGWNAAAQELSDQLRIPIHALRERLLDTANHLDVAVPGYIAAPQQICDDLLALQDEFEQVKLDLSGRTVSATTPPIELEGVYLGPFRIDLQWREIGGTYPYFLIAEDAHSAASESEITHPHVQGEALCEGDARVPIRSALKQGRLFDFFLIVRQTLETYNASSAYAQLDEWSGGRCRLCDTYIDEDSWYTCERCDMRVCDGCSVGCMGCDTVVCTECSVRCDKCEEFCCSGCMRTCQACEGETCKECLTDGKCETCRERETEEEQEERAVEVACEPPEVSEAGIAVLSDGLGQARVPA